MCEIARIHLESPELRPRLGDIFSPMLMETTEQGPDSSGVAVHREGGATGSGKVIVHDPGADVDREATTWSPRTWSLLTVQAAMAQAPLAGTNRMPGRE